MMKMVSLLAVLATVQVVTTASVSRTAPTSLSQRTIPPVKRDVLINDELHSFLRETKERHREEKKRQRASLTRHNDSGNITIPFRNGRNGTIVYGEDGAKLTRYRRSESCADAEGEAVANVKKTSHEFSDNGIGGLTVHWVPSKATSKPNILVFIESDENYEYEQTVKASNNIWISTTFGQSYEHPKHSGKDMTATIESVHISSDLGNKASYVYAIPTGDKGLYYSSDGGELFLYGVPVDDGNVLKFETLDIHPTNPKMFLGFARHTEDYAVEVDRLYHCVIDDEINCMKLDELVFFAEWLKPQDETVVKIDTILLTKFDSPPILYSSEDNPMSLIRWEATPGGASMFTEDGRVVAIDNSYLFRQEREYLFAFELPKATQFGEVTMWVSTDEGYTFDLANFPLQGHVTHFRIVDASEDMVFAAVQQKRTNYEGDATIEINGKLNFTADKDLWSIPLDNSYDASLDVVFSNNEGCADQQVDEGEGKVLVVKRGICKFAEKANTAAAKGYIGLIVINSDNVAVRIIPSDNIPVPDIPAFLISANDGETLVNTYKSSGPITVRLYEENVEERYVDTAQKLYTSDEDGYRYTVSLNDVAYAPQHSDWSTGQIIPEVVDVHKVACQTGTYIANYIDNNDYLKTVISFNKGAHWTPLPTPTNSRVVDGSPRTLHLSLERSHQVNKLPLPRSSPEVAGFIIANGVVSDGLLSDAQAHDTFTSRDGGVTWQKVLDGPHDFRIIAHGSIVIATPFNANKTKEIYVSYTQFALDNDGTPTFQKISLFSNSQGYKIHGLVASDEYAVAYVYYSETEFSSWKGMAIDFANKLRACDIHKDTELFFPTHPVTSTRAADPPCLLGQKFTLYRQKQCSVCLLPSTFKSTHVDNPPTPCICSTYDYKCTPGFIRQDNLHDAVEVSNCIRDIEYKFLDSTCATGDKTWKTPAYELVEGDGCAETIATAGKLDPIPIKCDKIPIPLTLPPTTTKGKGAQGATSSGGGGGASGGLIAAIIFVSLGFIATGLLYFSPGTRSRLISILGVEEGIAGKCGGCLSHFNCFRRKVNYQYSQLLVNEGIESDSEDEEPIWESDAIPTI